MATANSSSVASHTTDFVFDPPPITSLPVVGKPELRFPVRRVYCVGKNYADHVVEMGGDLRRSRPVFFTKPSFDGVVYAGPPALVAGDDGSNSNSNSNSNSTPIKYPPNTSNLHYEVELVVAIGTPPHATTEEESNKPAGDQHRPFVYGYAVGIDLTRRDLQGEAKSKGHPWDTGKQFDASAPMGPISMIDASTSDGSVALHEKMMELTVNGQTKQSVGLDKMIWKVPEIITELEKSFVLKPGDLIMTGTPAGVGPVVVGDRVKGTIDGLVECVDITLI